MDSFLYEQCLGVPCDQYSEVVHAHDAVTLAAHLVDKA
jgi:hypothetical protein